jgi:hypothetical protein
LVGELSEGAALVYIAVPLAAEVTLLQKGKELSRAVCQRPAGFGEKAAPTVFAIDLHFWLVYYQRNGFRVFCNRKELGQSL